MEPPVSDDPRRSADILAAGLNAVRQAAAFQDESLLRHAAEQRIATLLQAVEQSSAAILITDLHGIIEYANPAFSRITGYLPDETIGQNVRILKSGHQDDAFYRSLWATLNAGEVWRGEFHNRAKDGREYWESASIAPVRNPGNAVTHYVAVKEDITLRKEQDARLQALTVQLEEKNAGLEKARQELETLAVQDALTGVLNRRGLQKTLTEVVALSQRMRFSIQAMLIDLDNFKHINDTWGHGVGDALLSGTAGAVRGVIRQTDHLARVGGDEFVVLLFDSREAEAMQVGEKIRLAVSRLSTATPDGARAGTTCSVGIVPLGDKSLAVEELLQRLHVSLHMSKGEGKDRVTYERADGQVATGSVNGKDALRNALLDPARYFAMAQPVFGLPGRNVIGYEICARLDFPGYASPRDFLMFARQAGIHLLVDRLCRQACLRAAARVPDALPAHINISPAALVESTPEAFLDELMPLAAGRPLCVEINDQQILGEPSYLSSVVARIQGAGVKVALDNYGLGCSSVEALLLLEPDVVKIDQRLVQGLAGDFSKQRVLRRMLRMIAVCQAGVVAAGVETEADLEALLEAGVPAAQGFLLARPQDVLSGPSAF